VLATYKSMENTPSGDDACHGRNGPFPIRQRTAAENTPSMRAFVDGAQTLGLKHLADFNGAEQHGAGPYTLNLVNGVRINCCPAPASVLTPAWRRLTFCASSCATWYRRVPWYSPLTHLTLYRSSHPRSACSCPYRLVHRRLLRARRLARTQFLKCR
jgi:choline dehydrogenase-like flavoprotein